MNQMRQFDCCDTETFLVQWKRMCDNRPGKYCSGCPANELAKKHNSKQCFHLFLTNPTEAMVVVQEWADNNPINEKSYDCHRESEKETRSIEMCCHTCKHHKGSIIRSSCNPCSNWNSNFYGYRTDMDFYCDKWGYGDDG